MNKTQELISTAYLNGMMTFIGLFIIIEGIALMFEPDYVIGVILLTIGGCIEYISYKNLKYYKAKYFKSKARGKE